MYSLIREKNKVIGKDDAGRTTVLFDCTDRFKNIGCRPTRDYTRNEKGFDEELDVMIDSLFGHAEDYRSLAGTEEMRISLLISELLLADRLMNESRPLMIAMVDTTDIEARIYPGIIGWFNEEDRIFNIDSTNFDGFRQFGYDVVMVRGDDVKAERQLRAATYLLAEGGLLLMSSKDSCLFDGAVGLFIEAAESFKISEGINVYKIVGRSGFRHWFEHVDLNMLYRNICDEALECVNLLDEASAIQDRLRMLDISINRLERTAQKQWDLEMKQALLDLKEAIQYLILYPDDKYTASYKDRLISICQDCS